MLINGSINECGQISVMVLGESAKTRLSARLSRKWYIGREEISETDEQHHLGILRTVFTSTIHSTSERCTAASSLCSEFHWLKVWLPSSVDILLAVSNPVHTNPPLWR